MVGKRKVRAKVNRAQKAASLREKFAIIRMPEDKDEAPHWLFWLLVIVFAVFIVSIIWQGVATSTNLQAYLPYI